MVLLFIRHVQQFYYFERNFHFGNISFALTLLKIEGRLFWRVGLSGDYSCKALPVPFHLQCSLTFSGKPKLPADNYSISCVPAVIADCAPLSSDADLHSTITFIPSSSQPDVCVITGWACKAHRQIYKML